MRLTRSRRTRNVASVSTVSLFSTALVALALTNPGLPTTDVALNDSGVWVTRSADNLVGRFNHEAQVMDGAVTAGTSAIDVLQQGETVLVQDSSAGSLSPVDPASLDLVGSSTLPANAQVGLGGGLVAILDPADGRLWVIPATGAASFSADVTEPVTQVGADAVLAMGVDGAAHAAAHGELTTVATDGAGGVGPVTTETLTGVKPDSTLAITAVGAHAVVLDRTDGALVLPHQKRVDVADVADVTLQQPGPAAPDVAYADASRLVEQPIDGSSVRATAADGSGTAVAPVFLNGCTYGAWTGSGQVVRDCTGTTDDLVQHLDMPSAGAELRYRVNRDVVVLNELTGGAVWLADDTFELFDDWQDVLPSDADQQDEPDATPDQSRDPLLDRDKPNRPPEAADDDFGVRPGQTTILRLLDNDADPDGDVLTADVSAATPTLGAVQPIYGGSAAQVVVPADATGGGSFAYVADDGRGGTDTATVRLSVHGWDVNGRPAPLRESDVVVEQGASTQVNVLGDWLDPDGDDLMLTGAAATTEGDEVRFRPDGTVLYQDAGISVGRKAVTVLVSDGHSEPVEGTLWVDVRSPGQQAPISNPDHVTTVVGRAVVVAPLVNDTDPNGDQLRLARVDEAPPAVVQPDFDSGTFTFTSTIARTYYLTYLVTDGPSSTVGLVRVDVLAAPDSSAAPIAVKDVALLPAAGEVLVDVVANDVDPAGGVLVVQAVQSAAQSGISVEVLEHHILRVSEVRALNGPVTFTYTISNGTTTATGEVLVLPVSAPAVLQPPRAVPDEVVVRAGDIVTIPVLENDSHPDNATLTLVPQLAEVPDAADGLIFTAVNTVRFQAGLTAKTVYAVYEVTDPQGQRDSAQITIHIRPLSVDQNSAPRPRAVTARALAGEIVRIVVPLDGIDPDGDSVTLRGLASAPGKGRVTDFGPGWIEYEANRTASGVDTFTYEVEDAFGLRATASVIVGIAPAAVTNLPPLAVDDVVHVRPGRSVSVAAMTNDVDPEGDRLRLVSGGLELPDGIDAETVADRIVVQTPRTPGTVTIYYTIEDSLGARATGALVLDVSLTAPLKEPIARDDAFGIHDVVGKTTVEVPVLDNDEDPDGSTAALKVALVGAPAGASVTADKKIKVALTETPQVFAYAITDPDGLIATAFVRVPGTSSLPPALRAGFEELEVVSGEELRIDIRDVLVVAAGRTASITDAEKVSAVRGTGVAVSRTTLTYVSEHKYYGAAAISFEVTDGSSAEDPDGQTTTVTIPIRVLPGENEPPAFSGASMQVVVGEQGTTDLSKLATDPDPDDADNLSFAVVDQPGGGISAQVSGGVLTVSAARTVPKGTVAKVGVTVSDGTNAPVPAVVEVTVVASTRPLASANDDTVPEADQGKTTPVDVLANDSNPFPDTPLRLVSATVETGAGSAVVNGSRVDVTPDGDFVGTMAIRYTIEDATKDADRNVDGRILVTVQGRPGTPLPPTVSEVRSRTVVLTWSPPVNNGAVITGYTVASPNGYSRECPATTCTLEGLTNNVEYTFTVVAHNAVGDSDPSLPSATARPDAKPDAPQAPTLTFGDKKLTVDWVNASYSDRSAIDTVTLEISPAPPNGVMQKTGVTGSSFVWEGLANGTQYKVRVQALNHAPDPSDWSAYSAGEVPAGVPNQPTAPTAERVETELGGQITVTWAAPAANGDAISAYQVVVLSSGSPVRTIPGIAGTATTTTVTGLDVNGSYTFTVRATNKAGDSPVSAASNAAPAYGKPGAVGAVSAALIPGDTDGKARISFTAPASNGNAITYRYRANGGTVQTGTATTYDFTGLSNGSSYTFDVAACNAAGCAAWSPASGAVAPYGVPGTPGGPSWNKSGATDGSYSWSAPSNNGAAIDTYQWDTTGDASGGSGNTLSYTPPGGYSKHHSLRVRAHNAAGWGAWTGYAAGSTDDPPAPPATRVWVTRGSSAVGQTGCSNSNCAYYVINTENLAAGTYNVTCMGDWGSGYQNISGSTWNYSLPANGSKQVLCYYGWAGTPVGVALNGTQYERTTW